MKTNARNRTALVIGGGPAGASAALGLLRRGFEVTLLEQRPRWQGRVCGAFLSPEAAEHLDRLGLFEPFRTAAAPVRFSAVTTPRNRGGLASTGRDGRTAWALPRRALEEMLLDAVRRAGGRVETGSPVRTLNREGGGWRVETRGPSSAGGPRSMDRRAPLVVLADGRFSLGTSHSIPHSALRIPHSQGWFGWNASFRGVDQEPGGMSLHLYSGGYVGVLTFADGETNVCGLRWREGGTVLWQEVFEEALERQPHLRRLLAGARRTGDWRGVGPLPYTGGLRPSDGLFLAGDAAAVGDPFMGEGIGRALGAGPLLAEALDAPDPFTAYRSLWNRRYAARLRLGGILRRTLRRFDLFDPWLGPLLARETALNALAPLFHSGWGPRLAWGSSSAAIGRGHRPRSIG